MSLFGWVIFWRSARAPTQLAIIGLLLLIALLVWLRIASLLFVLFFSDDIPSLAELLPTLLMTTNAVSQPDAAAIQTADGVLSFAELDRIVSATARAFQNAGISAGDVVAIALADELAHMVASLGLARLGAGQIVFHGSDTPDLRAALAQRLTIAATITNDASKAVAGTPVLAPPPGAVSELRAIAEGMCTPADDPNLALYYQRSSGTTGRPRLGRVTHDMMAARMQPLATDGVSHKLLSLTHIDFEGAKQTLKLGKN